MTNSSARVASSLVAIGLLALAYVLPLWKMTLEAPQYPASLHLRAYGNRIEGDLREINIINHYIGMEPIDTVPAPEMGLFTYSLVGLGFLCALAFFHRRLRQLAILTIVVAAVVILGDLQLWLRDFGQNLKPAAPIRVEPFTPAAIGVSKIGNFRTTAMVSWGYLCLLGAALALYLGGRTGGKRALGARARTASACALFLLASLGARAETGMQARIDETTPGRIVTIHGGTHRGPIVIRGPMTVVGIDWPVVDGGGSGSVIQIEGDGVVLRGFHIRGSGRHVSEEAAGIKVRGSGHLIESNRVEDVYFGIHLSDGSGNVVRGNHIVPGERRGERPGHGVSLWYQQETQVVSNRIAHARDGVYLSFADDVRVEDNEVEESRYGVHSMSSKRTSLERNRLRRNLLGCALMYSQEIVMRGNLIENHREGATAYGILLKDIDELLLEENALLGNRVGIYADSTPLGADRKAIVRGNLFSGNDTALALQSTVRLTFVGNRVEDSLTAVRTEGATLSANRWSEDGRGNYWDDYHGYDRDGDGIGDLPYRYETVMNEIVRRGPLARAFVYTPAHLALETASRLFPVFRTEPLVVDEFPLMIPPATAGALR
jgi:nitrous oxidase accessory protein